MLDLYSVLRYLFPIALNFIRPNRNQEEQTFREASELTELLTKMQPECSAASPLKKETVA